MEATTAFKFQRSQVSAEHHPAILSGWSAHQRHDATCQVRCRCACVRIHPGLEGVVFGGSPSNRTVLFKQLHVLRLHVGIIGKRHHAALCGRPQRWACAAWRWRRPSSASTTVVLMISTTRRLPGLLSKNPLPRRMILHTRQRWGRACPIQTLRVPNVE